ncbi:hypothetical protein Lal_00030180, partial [Lupinus albus]
MAYGYKFQSIGPTFIPNPIMRRKRFGRPKITLGVSMTRPYPLTRYGPIVVRPEKGRVSSGPGSGS